MKAEEKNGVDIRVGGNKCDTNHVTSDIILQMRIFRKTLEIRP